MQTLNTVPFASVETMMRLVLERDMETCMVEIADYLEEDFRNGHSLTRRPA